MFLKTMYNPYKGLQRKTMLRKAVYRYSETVIAKWIPLQVLLTKISNFSNSYFIVHIFNGYFYFLHAVRWLFESIIFYWKS